MKMLAYVYLPVPSHNDAAVINMMRSRSNWKFSLHPKTYKKYLFLYSSIIIPAFDSPEQITSPGLSEQSKKCFKIQGSFLCCTLHSSPIPLLFSSWTTLLTKAVQFKARPDFYMRIISCILTKSRFYLLMNNKGMKMKNISEKIFKAGWVRSERPSQQSYLHAITEKYRCTQVYNRGS